jgi:hypothetical protein
LLMTAGFQAPRPVLRPGSWRATSSYEDAPPHGARFEFVVPQTGTSAADN